MLKANDNNVREDRFRRIFPSVLVAFAAVLLMVGCGGEEPPAEADTGVSEDVEVEEDASPDVHEEDIEEIELTPAGESCGECSAMPGDSTRCDSCESERCYTPLHGGGAYCVTRCNSEDECAEEGWTCEGRSCVKEDQI